MQASIKDLKDHLSHYLHLVRQGEELIVTSHNRPVAKLSPITETTASLEESRQDFFNEIKTLHKTLKGRISGTPASELVIKSRKERD